ncbi:MAG: hypothetical protein WC350_00805 [Candidatus Micrarchaeia archaeon]|jgi:hypothetical protein
MVELAAYYALSMLSLGVTLVVIAVAYALGQALQNPNFSVWAKTEIYQVLVSAFLVMLVLFMIGLLQDSVKYGLVRGIAPAGIPVYEKPEIGDEDNVFTTAEKYLLNSADFSYVEMRASRGLYGALDVLARYRRSPCMPAIFLCLYGPNGYNFGRDMGASSWMQVVNLSMYTDTVSYLTIMIQITFLRFIQDGGFLLFLPLAIVLRSLPFFRQLGGGLMGICIALFIIYPSLLFVESMFWSPHEMLGGVDGAGYRGLVNFGGEMDRDRVIFGVFENGLPDAYDDYSEVRGVIGVQTGAAAISFLGSTFLFSLNIITITAAAREMGRLLGQEADLSRLMHII